MPINSVYLQPYGTTRAFTRSQSIYPPLGLCQLAAMFSGSEAIVLDAEAEGLTDEATQARILSINPRIVGITVNSFALDIARKWSNWASAQGFIVIAGGPHPTIDPHDFFLQCPDVSYVVRGEAEYVIVELTRAIMFGEDALFPGVCSNLNGMIKVSEVVLRVEDLSRLPFPTFANLPISNYICPDAQRTPMITMQVSRGCAYACAFCSSTFFQGKTLRYHDVGRIIDQLEYLNKHLRVKEISFVDDGFTANKTKAGAICDGIVSRNLDLTWFCNARADCLDDELVHKMKLAGCHQIYIGFESGNDDILKNVNKRTNRKMLATVAAMLKNESIGLSAGFIVGLPGETAETVEDSITLAKEVRPERLQFSRFTPLPGSQLAHYDVENNGTFHKGAHDQINEWIQHAYMECGYHSWGKPSL